MARLKRSITGWFTTASGAVCTLLEDRLSSSECNRWGHKKSWNEIQDYSMFTNLWVGGIGRRKQSRDLEVSVRDLSFIFEIKTCSFMQNTERASISLAKTLQTFQRWGWDEVVWLLLSFLPVAMEAMKTLLMVKESVILREVSKKNELKTWRFPASWMRIFCPHLETFPTSAVLAGTLL